MPSGQAPGEADVVYVPAHPVSSGERNDIGFETRELESGGQAAIAFTSLQRLVDALGRSQPWLALPLGSLREALATLGVKTVAVDPAVPDAAWRWKPTDLEDLESQ